MKHSLSSADILSNEDYEKIRDARRTAMIALKKLRRVEIGPFVTMMFENYDTMWLQVQEMLRIEKGGAAQLEDELYAYNPMIPNGREWTATFMIEIADPTRRATILAKLGGIENSVEIRFDGQIVHGVPERDLEYTSADGKASSVQFLHFPFTTEQILKLRDPALELQIAVTHANYGHSAVMSTETRRELLKDFD